MNNTHARARRLGRETTSREVCPSCPRNFSLTAAGLMRTHGPVLAIQQWLYRTACSPEASHTGPQGTDNLASLPLPPAASSDHHSRQSPLRPIPPASVLKSIPRDSREQAGMRLSTILEGVVSKNNVSAWERLLHFSVHYLKVPSWCGHNWS